MALIPYKAPGQSLTAAEWNLIFAQVDSVIDNYTGGLSSLMVALESGYSLKFFFFNSTISPSQLHPLANLAQFTNGFTAYNHAAFTSAVGNATLVSSSDKFKVSYISTGSPLNFDNCLSVLTWTNGYAVTRQKSGSANGFTNAGEVEMVHPWDAVELIIISDFTFDPTWNKYNIFRIHNFGNATATMTFGSFQVIVPAGQCRCVRRTGAPGSYVYTQSYNYFHQMQMGDPRFFSVPNNSLCSVLAPGTFLNVIAPTYIDSNIGLPTVGEKILAGSYDFSAFWDMSALYTSLFAPSSFSSLLFDLLVHRGSLSASGTFPIGNNIQQIVSVSVVSPGSGYEAAHDIVSVPGGVPVGTLSYEGIAYSNEQLAVSEVDANGGLVAVGFITPNRVSYSTIPPNPFTPANTVFLPGTQSQGTGAVLQATYKSVTPQNLQFTQFSQLAALFAVLGLQYSYNTNTRKITLTDNVGNGGFNFILSDIGTNLMKILTGKLSTPSHAPQIFGQPTYSFDISAAGTFQRSQRLIPNTITTPFSYYAYSQDGNGNFILGNQQTVNVINNGCSADATDTVPQLQYYLDSKAQAFVDFLTAGNANGSLASYGNFNLMMTPFGPLLWWEETYALMKNLLGNLAPVDLTTNKISVKIVGNSLVIRRGFFLGSFLPNTFPSINPPSLPWHFPRTGRVYQTKRAVTITDIKPWNTPSIIVTSVSSIGQSGVNKVVGTILTVSGGVGTAATLKITAVDNFGEITGLAVNTPGSYSVAPPSPNTILGQVICSLNFGNGNATTYEPPNIKRWFETEPISTDTVEPTSAPEPTRPDGASYLDSVDVTDVDASLPANSTNALLCQIEHYNALASQVNGLPSNSKFNPTFASGFYTLDYTTIFLVNGGTGYKVNDTIGLTSFLGLEPLATVSSIGANGTITGITVLSTNPKANQVGTNSTPQRPMSFTGGSGTGATFDISSGNGGGLTGFFPSYHPNGVPIPTGFTSIYGSTFFPRECFFAWNGATAGGADPLFDYITSLGIPIQTTVPDGFGNPILNNYGQIVNSAVTTQLGTSTDYLTGFNPAFQALASNYRWIKISDVQAFYTAKNVPFILSETLIPLSFEIFDASVSLVSSTDGVYANNFQRFGIDQTLFSPNLSNPAIGNWIGSGLPGSSGSLVNASGGTQTNGKEWISIGVDGVSHGSSPPPEFQLNFLYTGLDPSFNPFDDEYQSIPVNSDVTQPANSGQFNIRQVGFYNNSSGNWACSFSNSPRFGVLDISTPSIVTQALTETKKVTHILGSTTCSFISNVQDSPVTFEFLSWQQNVISFYLYAHLTGQLPIVFDSILLLNYNSQDNCVIVAPKNIGYQDSGWILSHLDDPQQPTVFENTNTSLGNVGITPYIANNTVENSAPEITLIGGNSGETVITTNLANAQIIVIPVDN